MRETLDIVLAINPFRLTAKNDVSGIFFENTEDVGEAKFLDIVISI